MTVEIADVARRVDLLIRMGNRSESEDKELGGGIHMITRYIHAHETQLQEYQLMKRRYETLLDMMEMDQETFERDVDLEIERNRIRVVN